MDGAAETGRAEELIHAAVRVVEDKGVHGLTLRALGKEAGLSRGAPYHHFPGGKKQLLAAVAEHGFEQMRARMETDLEGVVDAAERVFRLAEDYIRFALENPGLYRVMFDPELADKTEHPELVGIIARIFDLFRHALAESVTAAGPQEGVLTELTHGVTALMHGLAIQAIDQWMLHGGDLERALEWTRTLVATLLRPHLRDGS